MSTMETELPAGAEVDLDRALLKKRRPWYYLALVLVILSIVLRQPLVLLAGLFTFLVGIVPELWFRGAMQHIIVRQRVNQSHLFFGEQAVLAVTVENRKLLPLPWLQVEDAITPPLATVSARESRLQTVDRDTLISTWLLWSFQRVTRRYRMTCHARGFHIFGPVRLRCSDPFGWLERELVVAANDTLLVYPLIAPIETLGLPSVHPMGDRVAPRHLLEDPLWFAGVRDYELGDDPRRIHWKASAHVGGLRSKIFESTTVRRLLLLLDTWTYSNIFKGVDFEIQEFCISIAASLAVWGLDEGYMVGLLANSSIVSATSAISTEVNTDLMTYEQSLRVAQKSNATSISSPGISVPFALEHGQYEQILSTLARMVPNYNVPIERVISSENEMFPQGTTIVLVSSVNTLSSAAIELLLERRMRGSGVNLVMVGELEPGKEMTETYDLPVHHSGGREKWHELVRTVGAGNGEVVGTSSTRLQLD